MLNERGANLLAQIIKERYHNVRMDNLHYDEKEFYYEFKCDEDLGENDFPSLEEEMKKRDASLYIKLLRIGGVYYEGNANNEMLMRIVGKVFKSREEKEEYLREMEEAKLRDHRKIGEELDLFCFSDYVGLGLPLYTPRGTIIKDELQKEIERVCRKYGFVKVSCPSLASLSLFETSGHAQKFGEELFRVSSNQGHDFILKPVQCPHHTQIYASRIRSYKELPIRYMESDKQYRAELPGAVGGLSRVYAITVEDGHSFLRPDQIRDEIRNLCLLIKDFYSRMGLWDNHWVSLSVRDKEHPEKYIGSQEDWNLCEELLASVAEELGLDAKVCEGEAALYGPKLDFIFKDALGRDVQIPTVQLDFAMPKRFNLFYIDEHGEKQTPVMVHRAVLGSYERFIALLLEQFKGVLPLWLSPTQVNIIPVNNKYHEEYALKLKERLEDEDIRVNYDDSKENLSKKIRNSNMMKNPYMVIIGDKERDHQEVSYRLLGSEETHTLSLEEFISLIKEEVKKR